MMQNVEALLDTWCPGNDVSMQSLRTQVQRVHLPAGQTVFHRGDPCRNYLVVVDGSVRVQALSAGGREVVLYTQVSEFKIAKYQPIRPITHTPNA